MSAKEKDTLFLDRDEPQDLGTIALAMKNVIEIVFDLKKRISAGIDRILEEAATPAGQLIGKVLAFSQMRLDHGCAMQRAMEAKIDSFISNRIEPCLCCCGMCQAKIDKAQKKVDRKAGKVTMPTADARGPGNVGGLQSPHRVPQPGQHSTSAGQLPGASSLPSTSPIPAPPSFEELDGLVVPMIGGEGGIPLTAFPSAMWQPDNPNRIWLSVEPSAVTRAEITAFRMEGQEVRPVGKIFFNIGLETGQAALEALLRELGVDPAAILTFSPEIAFLRARQAFGDNVAADVWDMYGLSHERVVPMMDGKIDRMGVAGTSPAIFQPLPGIGDVAPVAGPLEDLGRAIGDRLGEGIGRNVPPGVIDAVRDPFGMLNLRWPTLQEICDRIAPLTQWFGLDARRMPPCATFQETMRYLNEMSQAR